MKRKIFTVLILFAILLPTFILTGCSNQTKDYSTDSDSTNTKEITESSDNQVSKKADNYEKVIQDYFESLENADGEKQLGVYPEFVINYLKKMSDNNSMENIAESLAKDIESEYGKGDIKITYSITNRSEIDKEGLEKVANLVKSTFDEEIKVSAGYRLTIDITITSSSKDGYKGESDLCVYKINDKWCLLPTGVQASIDRY